MINRRSLIALSTVLPATRFAPRLDVEDTANPPLDTPDVVVIGISPDASTLVGVRNNEALCFLDATSLKVISESEPNDVLKQIDPKSVNWSPDSSSLAFSTNAWLYFVDSDIWVVDVATGEITNATAEGDEDETGSLMDYPDVTLDMYPLWIADSELLFIRQVEVDNAILSSIQTLTIGDAEPTELADLSGTDVRYALSPLHLLPDGTLTFTSQPVDFSTMQVTMVKDDEVRHRDVAGIQQMMQVSVNDTHSLVFVPETAELLLVPHQGDSEPIPFADAIGYDDRQLFIGDPVIGSNPDTYVGVAISTSTGKYRVFSSIGGDRRDHGYLEGGGSDHSCQFAGDTLLITTRENAWLIDLKV